MKPSFCRLRTACIACLITFGCGAADAHAQPAIASSKELETIIASLDTAFFDAYNRCDLEKFSTFLADNLELYHDRDGVILGRQKLVDSIRKNICGADVRRELVPGTLRVYRIAGFGAVEIGIHRFSHPRSNAPSAERTFINLWQFKTGAWKIARVLSFDHHVAGR